jgi:hypothetical protein
MRDLGASDEWIDRRVAMGWLAHVFRGVYGIGHPPRTRRGWNVAALLAGGKRSVLSHTTAAAVHQLAKVGGNCTSPCRAARAASRGSGRTDRAHFARTTS